ncbi:MAG TPA: NAD-dependent epimerase/dehydratase family protein [Desulfomonilaceae bacterium]|nr:NAD-dependent epimerase/dehydratase family protein [Desulfomonilaceae bacterium]
MSHPLERDLDHIVARTEKLWEELRGQRIFITGGTGFFGCWLLESFAWANRRLGLNAEAVVLSRYADPLKSKAPHLAANDAIAFHKGDITTFDSVTGSFSHVIHAASAASAELNREHPLIMFDTVAQGTRRTLDFALACGARKVLLTSSGAVYGRQPPCMSHIREDYRGAPDTMEPLSAYAEGKRAAEFLCSVYGRRLGLEVKIARCFSFVGPYLPLDIHYAVGNFIADGLCERPIHVKGDGTPYRSYLYAAELTEWLWTILFEGESLRPYNVGSSRELTVADLAGSIAKIFGLDGNVHIAQKPEPGKEAERYVPCVTRVEDELQLRQTVDLTEAVQKTAAWHRR